MVLWITLILHSVSKKGLKYKVFPPFSTPDASGFPQLFFTLKTVIHNIMWWDVPLLHNHCACRSDFLHFEGFLQFFRRFPLLQKPAVHPNDLSGDKQRLTAQQKTADPGHILRGSDAPEGSRFGQFGPVCL